MPAVIPERQTAYPVEVSGWDDRNEFFVEKTELHWVQGSGKHLELVHPIVSGTLLFLRLIDPKGIERVHPVPFRAETSDCGERGYKIVRLLPADPAGRPAV